MILKVPGGYEKFCESGKKNLDQVSVESDHGGKNVENKKNETKRQKLTTVKQPLKL